MLLRSDNERALLAFLRAAAASLEGVEVIEQVSPEGDHAASGLAEVGVREVKAQTRVLKSHLEERLKRQFGVNHLQHGWFDTQRIACRGTEFKMMGKRLISDAQESVGGVKLLNSEKKQHFYRSPHVVKVEWQVMRRVMDGIFVGHHERTGASLFLSERGLLRGTRVQRKTADQQWDNEFIRKCRGVPWMLIGEELR